MYLDLSNSLARAWADTMMFFGCSSRRITSWTDVFRTACTVQIHSMDKTECYYLDAGFLTFLIMKNVFDNLFFNLHKACFYRTNFT